MNIGATIRRFADRFAAFIRPGVTAAGGDGNQMNKLDTSIGRSTKHGSLRLTVWMMRLLSCLGISLSLYMHAAGYFYDI